MANNTYLLTAATVAGLAAGSIGTASLTARAGVPETKTVKVEAYYTEAQVASASGQQMANNGCALMTAKYEGATCSLDQMNHFSVFMHQTKPAEGETPAVPNMVLIRYYIPVDGTFTPGSAE